MLNFYKKSISAVLFIGAMSCSYAQPYFKQKPGANYHETAMEKWPSGKTERKKDSGQYSVTSYFVDRRAKQWSVGLGGGSTQFFGDADKVQPGWHAKAFAKYSISQTFGLRAEYNVGMLRGARDFQFPTLYKDYFRFRSNFQDYNIQMVFTLGNISFLRPLRKTQFNLFIGGGWGSYRSVARFNDQRLYIGGDYYLNHYFGQGTPNPNVGKDVEDRWEGRHWNVPFGFGIKHNLGKNFDIGLDYRQTYLRTDDIDLYNTAIWQNRWFDQYSTMTVYAAWKFGSKSNQHYDWLSPIESIYERVNRLDRRVDTLYTDTDGDGVSDFFDVDDSTEPGVNVYGNGTAIDSDGDGVADYKDKEPFSEKGVEVDAEGRMIDSDGDNVPNYRDLEPNSPIGAMVDARGRSIVNNCCNCDDMTFPSLFFETNKCQIRPEFQVVMMMIADKMKQCPDKKLVICGSVGEKEKLYAGKKGDVIGSCRTESIIQALVSQFGITRDRIVVDAACKSEDKNRVEFKFGGTRPIAPKPAPIPVLPPTPRSSR